MLFQNRHEYAVLIRKGNIYLFLIMSLNVFRRIHYVLLFLYNKYFHVFITNAVPTSCALFYPISSLLNLNKLYIMRLLPLVVWCFACISVITHTFKSSYAASASGCVVIRGGFIWLHITYAVWLYIYIYTYTRRIALSYTCAILRHVVDCVFFTNEVRGIEQTPLKLIFSLEICVIWI